MDGMKWRRARLYECERGVWRLQWRSMAVSTERWNLEFRVLAEVGERWERMEGGACLGFVSDVHVTVLWEGCGIFLPNNMFLLIMKSWSSSIWDSRS